MDPEMDNIETMQGGPGDKEELRLWFSSVSARVMTDQDP